MQPARPPGRKAAELPQQQRKGQGKPAGSGRQPAHSAGVGTHRQLPAGPARQTGLQPAPPPPPPSGVPALLATAASPSAANVSPRQGRFPLHSSEMRILAFPLVGLLHWWEA